MRRALLILFWVSAAVAEPVPSTVASTPPTVLPSCTIRALEPLEPLPPGTSPDELNVSSGDVEFALDGAASFTGGVTVRRGEDRVSAGSARYDRQTGEFQVSGDVEFRDPATRVRGDTARYDAGTGVVTIEGAEFDLPTVPARGSAGRLTLEQTRVLSLQDVAYTTCAPGKEDWLLKAGRLSIDRETGMGTARNARLEFMGLPILYAPYLTYPVTDQRKSGLLLPDFGRSEQRGLDLEIPYYFNLAPNYDATLTPRYMSRRGIQLKGEFRYLLGDSAGMLSGEFLPDDDVARDDRALVAWFNRTRLPAGWRATVDASDVSDGSYFEELYSGLGLTSQTHLEQRVDLEYFDHVWSVLLRVADYETLDEALLPDELPYRRIPQLAATGWWPRGPLGLEYGVSSEATWFDRSTGVTGGRIHLMPELALPLRLGAFTLEPTAALDHTRYSLNDTSTGMPESPDRTVPLYSVDLRTILERVFGREGRWLQTLEPRVQYVHVPFRDQDDLPVFDTIEPDFNLVQLFRRNRFAGLDRVGDTDQLSIGITTRLIDSEDGSQFLTATVGETQYFSSQDVVLPGQTPSDDDSSDYIAELGLNIGERWNVDLGYQWDSDQDETRLAEARVLYRRDDFRVLNVSYRFRRDAIREIDVAGAWPLADRWSIVGRYDYSLLDNQPLERFLGLEYSTCCWGIRAVVRRSLASREGESDTAFTLQLLLKGFGSTGSPAERMLDRGILGYDRFDRY